MRADVPRGGAAHAEAAVQDAVLVHGILALDGVEGFEKIHFAGELAGIADSGRRDAARWCRGARHSPTLRCAVGQKIDFAEGFIAAVEPGVQAPAVRRGGRIRRRHDQAVRLHAAVDFGDVAAHHQAGGSGPGGLFCASSAARSSPCCSSALALATSSALKNSLYCSA